MKRLLCCALFVLFACEPPPGPLPSAGTRIVTLNLEWLGHRSRGGRTQEDIQRLAEYVNELNADVYGLQEIVDVRLARRIFTGYRVECAGSEQKVCIASRLPLSRVRAYRDLNVGGLRPGLDAVVRMGDGRGLRLLVVHLKSGCHSRSLTSEKKACVKLRSQLPILERWIDARAREDLPFVVLGDFNRRMHSRDAFYEDLDDGQPANADLFSPGIDESYRCGRYTRFIDFILLDARATKLYQPDSFDWLDWPDGDEFILSDHCPIYLDLK